MVRRTTARNVALVALAALVAWTEAPSALAEPAEKSPKEIVKELDRDGDRKLSYEEFRAFQGNRYVFRQLDADDDGLLTASELARRMKDGKLDVGALVVLRTLEERSELIDPVKFDEDASGRIDAKEYRAWVFALADQDGDERIDAPEADFLAMAQPFVTAYHGEGAAVLKEFDRSKDGALSRAEFKLDAKWVERLDRNGDRVLAADELFHRPDAGLSAFANQDADALLERYDRDGDGTLEPGEIPGGEGRGLARADGDRDGAVSRDELDRALKAVQRNQFAVLAPSFLERYDLDGDRKVTAREFPGSAAAFARLDRNGDGVITKADG